MDIMDNYVHDLMNITYIQRWRCDILKLGKSQNDEWG